MARPSRTDTAIITPAEIWFSITRMAPRPRARDCQVMRTKRDSAAIRELRSLASPWALMTRCCRLNQRRRNGVSMPMAWITSAFCKVLLT
ncbi:hypothetical protein D3C80_1513200 [compost metagenome]